MRITGLASGLDMDQIIKDSMKVYRIKIDKRGQDKEILEIKQKLYREVIKDSRELYNKHFDITNKDSLLLSKSWATTKFTSSNESVLTVTGSGDAKADNYKITGQVAKSNQMSISEGINKDEKLVINGEEFILKGETAKDRATNLNNELKAKGINVSVKYTDFAASTGSNKSGFVFESTVLGKDNNFTVGGTFTNSTGSIVQGIDATGSTIIDPSFTIDNLKVAGGKISIGNQEIQIDVSKSDKEIKESLNIKLKDFKLKAEVNGSNEIIFETVELGSKVVDPDISINNVKGVFNPGIDATYTESTIDLNEVSGKKVYINGNLVDLTGKITEKEISDHINKVLKEQGVGFTASEQLGKIVLKSNTVGPKSKIDVKIDNSVTPADIKIASGGQDAEIVIENSKGGKYTHKGLTNSITLDGITFKFTGDIPKGGEITVNGKQDVTETKDKLVKFINDYNTLIEKLNTLTTEKRNKSFMPLTDEQKKSMSQDEIKLWDEKVKKGQLTRDNDLIRVSNSLKQAMRSIVEGSGLNLEKVGIKPVADYQGSKNGTFIIDENKLSKALEENSEEVMNLFIKDKPSDDNLPEGKKYSQTGLLQRLKEVLYNETVTAKSAIIKKAGIEGTAAAFNNEISRSITKYEQKMNDMERDFTIREQALYTKYSKLEVMMNKYNSQQSYLMQQLGLG
ncbi:flagellar filament capping protein FliD [Clostridium sp.]|uniref:flagellar filament capping protein FliD n=1 Tax=Clostridium sp. TaxID=1506 RepID=UPI002610E589|nr:flagellar filament capping protein FliD [Clostridium sp.]